MKRVKLFVGIADDSKWTECAIDFDNWKRIGGFDGTIVGTERSPWRGFIIECGEKTAAYLQACPLEWMTSVKRNVEVSLVLLPNE